MCSVDYWAENSWKWSWRERWNEEKVEDFVPNTTDSQDKDRGAICNERAAQWSDPNATALSIYRGVTYTNTKDKLREIKCSTLPQSKKY